MIRHSYSWPKHSPLHFRGHLPEIAFFRSSQSRRPSAVYERFLQAPRPRRIPKATSQQRDQFRFDSSLFRRVPPLFLNATLRNAFDTADTTRFHRSEHKDFPSQYTVTECARVSCAHVGKYTEHPEACVCTDEPIVNLKIHHSGNCLVTPRKEVLSVLNFPRLKCETEATVFPQ